MMASNEYTQPVIIWNGKSTHGTLIATLTLEKFSQEIKIIVARNVKDTWDLTKILDIVNQ